MIVFSVGSCPKCTKKIPEGYPGLTEYEFDFSIVINGKLFFREPNFPVFEFLYFVNDWNDTTNCTFEYFSIETEDNPLISFIFDLKIIFGPYIRLGNYLSVKPSLQSRN